MINIARVIKICNFFRNYQAIKRYMVQFKYYYCLSYLSGYRHDAK